MAKIREIKCKCPHCGELNRFNVEELLEVERQFGTQPPPQEEKKMKKKGKGCKGK